MNVYRTKFLEEKGRVKLSGHSDWTLAKYSDGHLYVVMGGQWVSEDQLTIAEKKFVSSPIAKILQEVTKSTSTENPPSSG